MTLTVTASAAPPTIATVHFRGPVGAVEGSWWRGYGASFEERADDTLRVLGTLLNAPELTDAIRGMMLARFSAHTRAGISAPLDSWQERALFCYLMAEEAENEDGTVP